MGYRLYYSTVIVTEIVPASTFYEAEVIIRNIIKREEVEAVITIQSKELEIRGTSSMVEFIVKIQASS